MFGSGDDHGRQSERSEGGVHLEPRFSICGCLGAQFVPNQGILFLGFPSDFAFLYVVGALCSAGVAYTVSRFELISIEEESESKSLVRYIVESAKSYFRVNLLALLWVAYALWYGTLMVMPNLSLYTHQAM